MHFVCLSALLRGVCLWRLPTFLNFWSVGVIPGLASACSKVGVMLDVFWAGMCVCVYVGGTDQLD